jgi:GTP-binding protein HflX
MWSHLDTVVGGAASGGVGTRGPGESQLETDRRLVNNRIAALTSQIKQIDDRKRRQVLSRGKNFTISLVGYTNAGKTTLMNTLTGSDAFAADQLFATLDTKTIRWTLDRDNYVLLSDTVGFVRDLPHHLIASFRATLEEAINADLLLHVLDVSHPQVFQQVDAVNKVLTELGCDQKDIILVPNKIDKPDGTSCSDAFAAIYPDAIAVSSRSGKGIDKLTEAVLARLTGKHVHLRISFPQTNGRIPSFLRAHGSVISEHYHDSQVTLEARLGRRQLPQLQQLHPTSYEVINPPAT